MNMGVMPVILAYKRVGQEDCVLDEPEIHNKTLPKKERRKGRREKKKGKNY